MDGVYLYSCRRGRDYFEVPSNIADERSVSSEQQLFANAEIRDRIKVLL